MEVMPSKGMTAVCEYLQTWTFNLSTTKKVSAVFHLNNKEAKRELKVNYNDETCPCAPRPNTSSDVGQDAHHRHFESLCKKLASRVALLRRLARSG